MSGYMKKKIGKHGIILGPLLHVSTRISFLFLMFIYLFWERERERERKRERENMSQQGEGQRESQAGSMLSVQSPMQGSMS